MLREFIARKTERKVKLNEGISHLEALPVGDFVHALKNLGSYLASEKLDGYNLWFGFDAEGFYTSRGGKGNTSVNRTVDDFPLTPANNGFRAVHSALEQAQNILKRHVQPGECVEVEVLFGRQPNAIVYGDNLIAFLRFVHDDTDAVADRQRIEQLAAALENKVVTTNTVHTSTSDGLSLQDSMESHQWRFVSTATIDSAVIAQVDVSQEVQKAEQWLSQANEYFPDKTNAEMLEVNLSRVPQSDRQRMSDARAAVRDTFAHDIKVPIKDSLVQKLLRDTTPKFQTAELEAGELEGIEGIVFLDPETNEQFKLVDKDLFTTVNKFNFAVRSAIRASSHAENPFTRMLGITDSDTSIMDNVIQTVGRIYGLSENLKTFQVRKALSKYGESPQAIIDGISANVDDFDAAKNMTVQSIIKSIKDLRAMHAKFKQNWKSYSVKVGDQQIRYSKEIYRRTMVSFAESHEDLMEMLQKSRGTQNAQQLAAVVFSRQLGKDTQPENQ